MIQLAYACSLADNVVANHNAVNYMCLESIPNVEFFKSSVLSIGLGCCRVVLSTLMKRPTDLFFMGYADGYFQYGSIDDLSWSWLVDHLAPQFAAVNARDVVVQVRGGDYLTNKNQKFANRSVMIIIFMRLKRSARLTAESMQCIVATDDAKCGMLIANLLSSHFDQTQCFCECRN